MTKLFNKVKTTTKRSKLGNLTLRGFSGGLNGVNSNIEMDSRYCDELENLRCRAGGVLRLRYGSRWFVDTASEVDGDIIDQDYFANTLIEVTEDGEVASVTNGGVATAIWNSSIAALLLGSPAGWSTGLESADFVPFKNEMIIHNGVDKPITISNTLVVRYLQDLATGSNVNVPIGKYGCVVGNYHCIAGLPSAPTEVYVSAAGTAGTFPGDPAPNDSISIDVGAYAPEGAPEIRGIAGFRNYLIVFFATQAIPIKLGNYNDDDVHVPEFPEGALPQFGLLGHRCIAQVENDLFFAGVHGIGSVKRNLTSGFLDSTPITDLIEPNYRRVISLLTDEQQLLDCYMIYDKLDHSTVLYTPGGDAFTFSANERLKYKGWNVESGPAYISACVSQLGRVFYSMGTRVYQGGNEIFAGENYYADMIFDRDANWTTGHSYLVDDLAYDTVTEEVYICIADHVSGGTTFEDDRTEQALDPKWELYEGTDIAFNYESPWIDGNDPMQMKNNRYVSLGTKGTSPFTFKVWTDNLYKDADGTVIHDPALEMDFIGNDAPGFGYDAGPYGGGRRSNDPRLFQYPVKFKSVKAGIVGATTKPLTISTISFLYSRGRYQP